MAKKSSYDQNRDMWKQESRTDGVIEKRYYVDGLYEKVVVGSSTEHLHYIQAGGKTVAVFKRFSSGAEQTRYLHHDHLGSVVATTKEDGAIEEQFSYDAWGKRRNMPSFSTPGPGNYLSSNFTPKGFTFHEQLDGVGLVHMNGRVYMPEIGRFLSPDPVMQFPSATQGLNRYTYVLNNPLSYTDPSGYSILGSVFSALAQVFDNVLMTAVEGAICGPQAPVCAVFVDTVIGSAFLYGVDQAAGNGSGQTALQPPSDANTDPLSEAGQRDISGNGSSQLERYLDDIGHRLAIDNITASAAGTDQSAFVDDMPVIRNAADTVAYAHAMGEEGVSWRYWLSIAEETAGWALIGFDVINTFVSPTPDVGIVGLGMITSARAARGAASAFGGLSRAGQFGIQPYNQLTKALKGTGLQAHHLLEQGFAGVLGQNARQMASVAVTKAEHQAFTNAWRSAIPYGQGTANATRQQVLDAARQIYSGHPELLRALGL